MSGARAGAVAVATGAAVAAAALALAPAALAHARPLGSSPADGAVLAAAPTRVTVRFDDTVFAAPGAAAIRNGDGSVLAGPERASGKVVTIPLQPGLGDGDYTVRWRVLGDDGHLIEGVLAFGVGAGRAPPLPQLGLTGSGPRWAFVAARWLFLAGTLLALGGLAFRLLAVGGPRGLPRPLRPHATDGALLVAISASFAVALVGAGLSIVAVPDSLHTRFGQAAVAGIAAAAIGAALAEVGRSTGRFVLASAPAAVALVAIATAGGHALDPPAGLRPLKVAVDLVHLGAAAVWIGGAVQVALLVPRLAAEERGPALRRFGVMAAAAVAVVAASGVGRAAFGLSSVHQAWDTGYGRTLLVKTGLLAVAVALAAVVRRRLGSNGPGGPGGPGGAGSRTVLLAELAVITGIVVAVAILGDLRPGRDAAAAGRPAAAATRVLPPLPPAGALTLAREEGDLAFAVAVEALGPSQLRLTASVVGQDRLGVDGLAVRLGADAPPEPAAACGSGCYTVTVPAPSRLRQVTVSLGGKARPAFVLPTWPPHPAAGLVRKAATAFRGLHTLRFTERLASSATNVQVSHQRVVAPDRFAYEIAGGGAGVVIGTTRWDRFSGSPRWTRQETQRLTLPMPAWGDAPTNAFEIGRGTIDGHRSRIVTLLDPALPAWFTVWIDEQRLLPLRLEMTAAAHFMVDDYGPFDTPLMIVPPVGTGG